MKRADLEKVGIHVPAPLYGPDLQRSIDAANAAIIRATGGTPAKSPARSKAARSAQDAGAGSEAEFIRACRRYRRAGEALVQKVPTDVQRLGKRFPGMHGGEFVGVYKKPDPADGHAVDFVGVALVAGVSRAIRVEVKSSSTSSMPLKRQDGQATVTREQVEDITLAERLGAVAGVLLRVQPAAGPRWYWLPASVWMAEVRAAEADGKASVYLERLEAVGRLCERLPCGAPDWLRVVG